MYNDWKKMNKGDIFKDKNQDFEDFTNVVYDHNYDMDECLKNVDMKEIFDLKTKEEKDNIIKN